MVDASMIVAIAISMLAGIIIGAGAMLYVLASGGKVISYVVVGVDKYDREVFRAPLDAAREVSRN